jgi:hypothetical protein
MERQKAHHTISGNFLLFYIHQMLTKMVLKKKSANFVTKRLVDAAVSREQYCPHWR